jgi:hypothetical protein
MFLRFFVYQARIPLKIEVGKSAKIAIAYISPIIAILFFAADAKQLLRSP